MDAAANPSAAGGGASWHAMSADEVLRRLATNGEKGLDADEASARFQKYGPNRLPEGKKRGPFMRFAVGRATAPDLQNHSTCAGIPLLD